ncbi:tripartite motif-containing protein 2 [Aplysia californica]|uniref:Tripartite motif-containing protein 2 n=1 Tax=Aplysia californica TaxID=6500 RepID=A0ABM1VPH4_APLCA|nr:tripartite motif-containing protein 2 [Aplysia californica]XP_035824316.1 tripartite motif-containing protein 2 [Aplysia californica]
MAQFGSADLKSEKLADEFLQCPLCFEQFISPKVLPCQHTFCLACLRGYVVARAFYNSLPCPLCKEVAEIPGNDVGNLKNNFMVVNLLQFVQSSKKATEEEWREAEPTSVLSMTSTDVRECGACNEPGRLSSYCHMCSMWLCNICSKAHRRVPSTAPHPLVSNEEVDRQCKEMVLQGEMRISGMQVENVEKQDFYLCQMRQLPENIEAVKSKIKSSAKEAQETIKEKMKDLLQKVETFSRGQESVLSLRLHEAEEKKKSLDNLQELLNMVKISSDGQSNQHAIKSVEEFLTNKSVSEPHVSTEKTVSLVFTPFGNSLGELKGLEIGCLRRVTNSAVTRFLNDRPLGVNKEACLVEREYISALAINKLAHKFVVANNRSVLVLKHNSKAPQPFLSALSERNVTRPWGIAYSVEDCRVFISEAGEHEGEGAVISYNHDGAFHSVIASGLTLPRGIAVHKNLVFVCDQIDKCVYIMNVWGKIIRLVKKTPGGQFLFNGPMFVSVGKSGTFAVSDNCNSVKIFDKDCNHLFTYTSELADSEFWDVLVLQNDTVVVCDWKHGLHKISPDHASNGLISIDSSVVMREPSALAALNNGNSIYVGTCGGEIFSAI